MVTQQRLFKRQAQENDNTLEQRHKVGFELPTKRVRRYEYTLFWSL